MEMIGLMFIKIVSLHFRTHNRTLDSVWIQLITITLTRAHIQEEETGNIMIRASNEKWRII